MAEKKSNVLETLTKAGLSSDGIRALGEWAKGKSQAQLTAAAQAAGNKRARESGSTYGSTKHLQTAAARRRGARRSVAPTFTARKKAEPKTYKIKTNLSEAAKRRRRQGGSVA